MHLHGISVNCKLFIVFIVSVIVKSIDGQYIVEVWEPKEGGFHAVLQCGATGADFGGEVPVVSVGDNGTGCAYFTTPEDSCRDTFNNHTECINYYAVVPRGNCSFSEKAYHAQRGRPDPYGALIIFNDEGHSPVPMAGSKYADQVVIPVVMVSHACMTNMMGRYSADKGYVVALRAIPGYYDLVKYLIPLVAVVAFCFVVLCISLGVRVCRERRRLARKRLSKRNLKKLPTKRYKKGDTEESCAICIDEFVEGEKLRVLPCSHAYHCKCIDPWLTKVRKVCPICKRKVLSSGESDSSDSDVERRNSTSASGSTTAYRENAPLLRNAEPVASGRPTASSRRASGSRRSHPSGHRPPLRVVILSPSDIPPPQPRTTHVAAENRNSNGSGTVSNRMQAVSDSVRRTLRPYYQQIVNRSIRVPWRNAAWEPECESEPNAERPFAADNDAFDEGSETFNASSSEGSSVADEPDRKAVGNVSPKGSRVNERHRHLAAASGRLTDAELNLQVELPVDNQQNVITTGQVSISESNENTPPHAGLSASSMSANLISTENDSAENAANSNLEALMVEVGASSSIQPPDISPE